MERPADLTEAIRYFSDVDVATDYVAGLRWPDGFVCPHCGSREYSYLSTRRLWKCKSCRKQSSVKVGTVFEGSALGLDKWLPAIWLAANSEGGISSHELARLVGTTQKSAWFMLRRIREATPRAAASPAPHASGAAEERAQQSRHLPGVRFAPESDPRLFALIVLGVFALGAVVGWLAARLERRV